MSDKDKATPELSLIVWVSSKHGPYHAELSNRPQSHIADFSEERQREGIILSLSRVLAADKLVEACEAALADIEARNNGDGANYDLPGVLTAALALAKGETK